MHGIKPLLSLTKGQIYNLLDKSYSDWSEAHKYKQDWITYDNEIFENPLTVGKCGFATFTNNLPIGFISWDPRNYPEFVIIGHNCILHKYRRKGFGKLQIKYACDQFTGFKLVKVSTGSSPFFTPARRMYESVGFIQKDVYRNDDPETIYYELTLNNKA